MNWIKDKIKKFSQQVKKIVRSRPTAKEVAEGLFKTCPVCSKINLKDEMKKNYEICSCSYHFEISPIDRFQKLFDSGAYEIIKTNYANPDPLKFEMDGTKYIDKRKKYQKITKMDSALLGSFGKINNLSAVVVAHDWRFGGGAWSPQESDYFVECAQKAIDEKVDLFLTIYQTGGVAVTTGVTGLASAMVKGTIALQELKKKNILTIAIACAKTTGGPYASTFFNHDLVGIEEKNAKSILFAGARVSRNASTGELPQDFGTSVGLERTARVDFVLDNRHEIKNIVTTLTKILKKKNSQENLSETNETKKDSESITSAAS